jgi:D-amino peptidase
MNVLIGTDIEGVAGVTSFQNEAYDTGRYYEHAKRLLTAEINAAVDGLLDARCDDILVVDGHGPGGVLFDDLHEAAKLLHGRPLARRSERGDIVRRYDVCMMIGQHAMAGVEDGTLNHTQSSRDIEYFTLNGKPIGEIGQFAMYHGHFGLPLIFLSGDIAACREAEELVPRITTAAVKEGLSRLSAISVSKVRSRALIREAAASAIQKQRNTPLSPVVWEAPYVLEKKFLFTEIADRYDGNPMYERVDAKTVRVRSESILDVIYA